MALAMASMKVRYLDCKMASHLVSKKVRSLVVHLSTQMVHCLGSMKEHCLEQMIA